MCTRNQAFEILKIVYHACDPILGHSIHDAILYGSYARGDFTAESDIDILLTADLTQEQIASQRRAVAGVASTLSLDHDITVSVHVVPLAQFRRYADFLPFYLNVLNETLAYQVTEINAVLPYETDLLGIVPGEDLCTLVTCTPYGINTHRLLVRGSRIPYEEATVMEEESATTEPAASTWETKYLQGLLLGCAAAGGMSVIMFLVMQVKKRPQHRKGGRYAKR